MRGFIPSLTTINLQVNNMSAEIMRMFNSEMNALAKSPALDFCPGALRSLIDEQNSKWDQLGGLMFRAGFAQDQESCELILGHIELNNLFRRIKLPPGL